MSNDSVITEEMRNMIGLETGRVMYDVDKTMLRGIAEAIDDTNPRWLEEAAPGFIISAMVTGGGGGLPESLFPLKRMVAGGGDWDFFHPVKIGDVITCTSKFTDIYERQGKAGTLLFLVTETIVTNRTGEIAAKGKSILINY
ncbi:MAG: MaoC family dehydratase N-terminal domain-containing protein [Thermodesulfobacteriota bacterium]|nr:MaoC family dehydratase N-terminal domain-containing protein [Thermodesulfobacteriota bacterium]